LKRVAVVRREGRAFVLADGTRARFPSPPLVGDEVTVHDDGVIVEVHHVRTAFGFENREAKP
jgi:hypothetical protein